MIPTQFVVVSALVAVACAPAPASSKDLSAFSRDASGIAATLSTQGRIDRDNPFFQSLGTNGRSCDSCHVEDQGWTITPAQVRRRFDATQGTDPIFRLVDGATSPNDDVSTPAARRRAYSMLLTKGLIRVGLPMPQTSEFELVAVDDPYDFASAAQLSLFRRPLPTTNLKFLSTVMWDGRETFRSDTSTNCLAGTTTCFAGIHFDLRDQANAATHDHAQATQPLTEAQRREITAFETSLFTAQVVDDEAGPLMAHGGLGGPVFAATTRFHFGINDALAGDYRTHAPFDPSAMTLYRAWARDGGAPMSGRQRDDARAAIARGEALFNTRAIRITGVAGLNDDLGQTVIQGTCTTCHDTPNAGSHSVPAPLNIGIADASRRTPDLPLYTFRNKASGELMQVTDPGRALLTGRWVDIGRFKGPVLRALATRAPYFHNGSAADLPAVVDFYDTRFGIGFTAQEKADLVAFLRSL